MAGQKTNETEGTRALLRNTRTSAYKIREVLDLVRGLPVGDARDILRFSERDAARLVMKLLDSAVANAENNDGMVPDELFVSSCFADEGRTSKTFRPRARGRAGRLRKRTAHVTIIVSRLPEQRLTVVKAKQERVEAGRRTRRVAASQQAGGRRARAEGSLRKDEPETFAESATAAADEVESDEIVDQQNPAIAEANEAVTDDVETEDAGSGEGKADAAGEGKADAAGETEDAGSGGTDAAGESGAEGSSSEGAGAAGAGEKNDADAAEDEEK